ncbi:MAG: aminopeptidase [Candidatus Eisenbacteria bacterium]|nr:aminopeptidase [Candidatus Eisenbacteria bacterium]
MDPRITRLADLLVNYSCGVKKGENVLVECFGFSPLPLVDELVRVVTRKGGNAFVQFQHDRLLRTFLLHANEEQIKAQAKHPLARMKDMQCYIGVRGAENTAELSDVPGKQNRLYALHYRKPVHMEQRVPHTRWVVLRYPNDAMAQNAKKPTPAFEDFYFSVCTMDYPKMSKAMNPLKRLMEKTDKVAIKSPGTDLTFSIKGLPAIKCDGKMNIPDGELFTAPVRESINGTVRFNAGSLQDGVNYGDINLTFRNGKAVKAESGANTKKLNEVLDQDEGARYVGEFSFGFNPFITETMLDILFDEKIAGSFHMALGNAYDECDNKNRSALHWDLIQIQTPERGGGEIWFDGKLIRKDGLFVPAALQGLNPENLKK